MEWKSIKIIRDLKHECKHKARCIMHVNVYVSTDNYIYLLYALQIMPLENEMKTPKAFGGTIGVLNIAMSVIVTLYVGMGLLGYLAYGALAKGSITLNIGDEEV